MSDYLGPLQTRVLDADYRSFESVVYQKRKPPLSSEINLSNKIDTEQTRQSIHNLFPSGWAFVGELKEGVSEDLCSVGDLLTSSSLPRNSVKLIAKSKGELCYNNIAWVNGWPVLVQGVGITGENNLILPASLDPLGELEPSTSGHNVNFVFLEVWRKLILPTDSVIQKYGNIQYGGTNLTNDLIDCSVNYETSLRVQIQYRIRVVANVDIQTYPEGFDPNNVFVQGPLTSPNSTCSDAYFTRVPGDIGLWRAGAGDSVAQTLLGTVDGYTYAIPMFAIARRNKTAYDPINHTNGAGHSLADYHGGLPSDRPDNLYNDWIVPGDILDLRHRVGVNENFSELAKEAFDKLTKGKLRTKMSRSNYGEDHFGVVMTQDDPLVGDGIKRVFSNAPVDQTETISIRTIFDKTTGTVGGNWTLGDRITISSPAGFLITSISYVSAKGYLWGGTFPDLYPDPFALVNILPASSIQLIYTSMSSLYIPPLRILYTMQSIAGNGLTKVPEKFLEFRNTYGVSIASKDIDIPVRDSSAVGTSDGTFWNMLMNRGGNATATEMYDFGHQMKYYAVGNGMSTITIPRMIGTTLQYSILGPISVKVDGTVQSISQVTRNLTDYSITLASSVASNKAIELCLYTGTHFFDTNKQGRAVTDSFEMAEILADQTGNGVNPYFTIDSTNRYIKSIATLSTDSSAYAYADSSMYKLVTSNKSLLDSTSAMISVRFITPPPSGSLIYVPVLMKSPIPASETYRCFYETVPYQGILDATTSGLVRAEGPAIITTSGSGAITDYTYADGTATFVVDTTTVAGAGTQWLSNTKSGYVLHSNSEARDYAISEVISDTVLHLKNVARTSVTTSYSIIAKDQPYFNQRNIFDRLPMYDGSSTDATGTSGLITTAVSDGAPILETRIINRVQDITRDATIGVNITNPTYGRGRSTIHMSADEAPLGNGNLGLKFEKLATLSSTGYQKTYQSYVFDKDSSGHLCLMVVGSESDQTSYTRYFNEKLDTDVVDIFELPGRPIINSAV